MIAKLKKLLMGGEIDSNSSDLDEKTVATAALLIEAAMSDDTYCEEEKVMVSDLLRRHYDLSNEQVASVIAEAEAEREKAEQILHFTRTVKETVEFDDRVHIIEMLWEMAYADGEISDYEANLIRRVCGLIYVDDVESGKARKKVQARIAQN